MVVIRLSRTGAKNSPFYHVVVTDSRNARDSGRYIERLGYYNPKARGQEIPLLLKTERIDYWTSKGAQLSNRIITLIKEFAKKPPQSAAQSKTTKKSAQVAAEERSDTDK